MANGELVVAGDDGGNVVSFIENLAKLNLSERIVELERTLLGEGWERIAATGDFEFSRDGLTRIIRVARLSYLKNPLIRRAVDLQADYVFAMGVSLHCDDEPINASLQKWWDDPKNKDEFTSDSALHTLERELRMTGNVFMAMFTHKLTGRVVMRAFPVDEILEVISNPEDRSEPWFYKRVWKVEDLDVAKGQVTARDETFYYPDWQYNAKERPKTIAGFEVKWDTPVLHIKTGCLKDMRFGLPEVYASLDWARAVKEDLEDYSTIRRALAKFAWRMTMKAGAGTSAAIASAKARFNTGITSNTVENNPPPTVGSMFISGEGTNLEPMPRGQAPNPEEGRRLWLMTGAGVGFPETILSGDANVGNLATATSLDRPTELRMVARRNMWTAILQSVGSFVVQKAAEAAQNPLKAKVVIDPVTDERFVSLKDVNGEPQRVTIEVNWPPLLERDPNQKIQAVISAATMDGKTPTDMIARADIQRMLLTAAGEPDVDEMQERADKEAKEKAAEEEKKAQERIKQLPPAMQQNIPKPGEQPPQLAAAKQKEQPPPTPSAATAAEEELAASLAARILGAVDAVQNLVEKIKAEDAGEGD